MGGEERNERVEGIEMAKLCSASEREEVTAVVKKKDRVEKKSCR